MAYGSRRSIGSGSLSRSVVRLRTRFRSCAREFPSIRNEFGEEELSRRTSTPSLAALFITTFISRTAAALKAGSLNAPFAVSAQWTSTGYGLSSVGVVRLLMRFGNCASLVSSVRAHNRDALTADPNPAVTGLLRWRPRRRMKLLLLVLRSVESGSKKSLTVKGGSGVSMFDSMPESYAFPLAHSKPSLR